MAFDPKRYGEQNPKLKAYWKEYDHAIKWKNLYDAKMRSDGCYVVLAWKEKDGSINMADLACSGGNWEMQNDGHQEITEADWKKLRLVPECDWFYIPGNPNFKSLAGEE